MTPARACRRPTASATAGAPPARARCRSAVTPSAAKLADGQPQAPRQDPTGALLDYLLGGSS